MSIAEMKKLIKSQAVTEKQIKDLYAELGNEEIEMAFTKNELTAMFQVIYLGHKPLSRSTKMDIVKDMRHCFHGIERAKAMLANFKH